MNSLGGVFFRLWFQLVIGDVFAMAGWIAGISGTVSSDMRSLGAVAPYLVGPCRGEVLRMFMGYPRRRLGSSHEQS